MENEKLVLRIKDQYTGYVFENKVFVVDDKTLIDNISKPNIKNQDSSLVIVSSNDQHISDVIQVKVNVTETGHFLVSFGKEGFSEEIRKNLLTEIASLKTKTERTVDTETEKIKELIGILNKYRPIYSTFNNNGDIKIDAKKLSALEVNFPLLILAQSKQKMMFTFGKSKSKKEENKREPKNKGKAKDDNASNEEKEKPQYRPFPIFTLDYLFVSIFSLLASFAIPTAVFEFMNRKNIGIFLTILAVVFTITLLIAVHSTIYKKGILRNPYLRFYLIAYILVGVTIGIVVSYFVCKGVLKTEIENFNYKLMLIISIPTSLVVTLATLSASRLLNIYVKHRLAKKEQE